MISIGNLREESLKDIIKRGASIKWYSQHMATCPPAMDKDYIKRTYSDKFPIMWHEFFTDGEIIK